MGIVVYDDYGAMISHPGLQAVWASTNTDVHASQTLAAIGKNLHVFCEKPLSKDMGEVRRRNFFRRSQTLKLTSTKCI